MKLPLAPVSIIQFPLILFLATEDEDYLPPGSPPQPSSSKPKRNNASKNRHQHDDNDDENLPLAQHALQQQLNTSKRHHSLPQGNKNTNKIFLTALDEITGLPCPLNFKFEVPEDVLHNILHHSCRINGAIPSASIALCINKAWRNAVLSCPELWKSVDLSFGWCRPTNSILELYLLKWTAMEKLSLEGCGTVNETALIAISENCPRLYSLNLSHCTGFREKGLGDALCNMFSRPKNENSSPLRDLDLSFIQISPKGSGLDGVLRRILVEQAKNPTEGPVLESLFVVGCPMLSHRPFKTVFDASVAAGKPLLGALKTLNLDGSAGLHTDFTLNLIKFQLAAPNLKSLHACHVARAVGWRLSMSTAGLPDGAAQNAMWSQLQTLRITGSHMTLGQVNSDIEYLTQMLRSSPCLEEIALIGFRQVYFDDLTEILSEYTVSGLPRYGLNRLTLDGTFISGHRIAGIVGEPSFYHFFTMNLSWMGESLEELSVMGCKDSFNYEACEELARNYHNLIDIDARETGITEIGVKTLVKSALERGLLSFSTVGHYNSGGKTNSTRKFTINIDSCRGIDRKIRQAASKSMQELVKALGL